MPTLSYRLSDLYDGGIRLAYNLSGDATYPGAGKFPPRDWTDTTLYLTRRLVANVYVYRLGYDYKR